MKKYLIVVFFLSCLLLIFSYSHTKEEVISFYINDVYSSTIPQKSDCYQYSHSTCNNGASIEWNNDVWGPTIVNLNQSRTKCEIYFKDPYIVTFDPDGGEVNVTSKEVRYGFPYGDLPTPTKEGYTFKGWNGKNMFDEETILLAINGATYQNDHYVFTFRNAYNKYGNGNYFPITNFKPNTQYTLSVWGYVADSRIWFNLIHDDDSISRLYFGPTTETKISVTSKAGGTVTKMTTSYNTTNPAYITHMQLEEGATSTEFEPYYIDNNTIVVQQQNHTLKALWEPN